MRPLIAIAKSTIRAAFRSHLVLILLGLLAVVALILPLVIRGDRTAMGLVQISLTYMLGAIGVLLSLVTVWLGCTVTSDEIAGYQIHLVTSKPVSRKQWVIGKFLGIIVLQAALLIASTSAVYGLLQYRLNTGDFPKEELQQVRNEVLTGRRRFASRPSNMEESVDREFQRRLRTTEMPAGMTENMVKNEIRRQVKARLNELPPGQTREWTFKGIPQLRDGQHTTLRYRLYVNKVSKKKQRETQGRWYVLNPEDNQFYPMRSQVMSGVHHEIKLMPGAISKEGHVTIGYQNRDLGRQSVVFQVSDGPFLLADEAGFAQNYARTVFLMFLQLAFLGVLGCIAGANLTTPVAIFTSFAYVIIGAIVTAMQASSPEDEIVPSNPALLAAYLLRKLAGVLTVSVNEFNEIPLLARGQLIEWSHIAGVALNPLLLHTLLLCIVGLWTLSRRDIGIVIRRR